MNLPRASCGAHQPSSLSRAAAVHLPGTLERCSWALGWRSLLLREYAEPARSERFTTPPCPDQLIVLVLDGPCRIRGRYRGEWQEARYEIGSIGTTRPGESVTLDFAGKQPGRTLQLHLPGSLLQRVAQDLGGRAASDPDLPHQLELDDAFIRQSMLSLAAGARAGAPELYAHACAEMLAAHLLVRHGSRNPPGPARPEPLRLRRVDDFMRAHLAEPLTLDALAAVAGVSTFHLIRLFKAAYAETPYRHLTRLRMEAAQVRLQCSDAAVTEIALGCGYDNPSHFAAAFRRLVGIGPRAYRLRHRT